MAVSSYDSERDHFMYRCWFDVNINISRSFLALSLPGDQCEMSHLQIIPSSSEAHTHTHALCFWPEGVSVLGKQ